MPVYKKSVHSTQASVPWSAPMVVVSPMSLIPFCLCLVSEPQKCVNWSSVNWFTTWLSTLTYDQNTVRLIFISTVYWTIPKMNPIVRWSPIWRLSSCDEQPNRTNRPTTLISARWTIQRSPTTSRTEGSIWTTSGFSSFKEKSNLSRKWRQKLNVTTKMACLNISKISLALLDINCWLKSCYNVWMCLMKLAAKRSCVSNWLRKIKPTWSLLRKKRFDFWKKKSNWSTNDCYGIKCWFLSRQIKLKQLRLRLKNYKLNLTRSVQTIKNWLTWWRILSRRLSVLRVNAPISILSFLRLLNSKKISTVRKLQLRKGIRILNLSWRSLRSRRSRWNISLILIVLNSSNWKLMVPRNAPSSSNLTKIS